MVLNCAVMRIMQVHACTQYSDGGSVMFVNMMFRKSRANKARAWKNMVQRRRPIALTAKLS